MTPWGIMVSFSLPYPLLPGFWGYHGFLRSPIPALVCFCGYRILFLTPIPAAVCWCGYGILFLTPIPAAARLLGVSYWLSCFHTRAGLLLRVSHSFSYSHTRYYMTSWGIMVSFSLPYPLLPGSFKYEIGFLAFIPTTSDSIYTIRYLPQITLTLNERFRLYNSGNTRQ